MVVMAYISTYEVDIVHKEAMKIALISTYWRRRASKVQKSFFALSSRGARNRRKRDCAFAQGVHSDPQG
ncbi:hypothetical protein A2673_01620 [Candidatus Kaiserbacteria bacterium RIFCSPHIGHO2_01_FULL_50_13]|uniref:Uncharacterized protein n=1 Tax=Candidatus Kaiserbacteria bacterium RIFCSPLOWO2_01_FULL_50_24 TaxID=1798507 RepID=A0A1F6EMG0_9BACT|nr:MAG: hypothetical protein A2673_01620 [Candidatus Kaiserbacteria bacterium RIFCSPHIGHO2_01_FULL_50_13]OGG74821.1 MAG: hypothetical protein A3A34_00320 [Candidatus Kaiserbacteria bacterium RIFCSPLOWO2_01_FULL_50_24]OGG81404.1 MAG: hypothetical protein A3H74_03105 [Candidatus Kaiserbacteria bacterium RIFCSPLOWO2_02_FULL_51_13]